MLFRLKSSLTLLYKGGDTEGKNFIFYLPLFIKGDRGGFYRNQHMKTYKNIGSGMKKAIFVLMVMALMAAITVSAAQAAPKLEVQPILKMDTGGHMALIRKIAVTKDGRYIVSASDDKTIRVWNSATGQETRKILGQIGDGGEGMIYAIALSPDDRWLAVGGFLADNPKDGSAIRLYDFATGRIKAILKSHENVVQDLAFPPDGRYLVSGSQDKTVRVWEMKKAAAGGGQPVQIFREHTNHVYAVRIFPHGSDYRIVSAGFDNKVILYSLNQGRAINTFSHGNKVSSLAVTQAGGRGYIASAGYDKKINIFDLDLNHIKTIYSETRPVGLAFSPDGGLLLVGFAFDHRKNTDVCNTYDTRNNFRKIASNTLHDNATQAVAFLNSSTAVTGGGDNYDIYLWDPLAGKELRHIVGGGKAVWSVGIRGEEAAFGNIAMTYTNEQANRQKSFRLDTFSIATLSGNYNRIPTTWSGYSLTHAKGGDYGKDDAVLVISRNGSEAARVVRASTDGYVHKTYGFTNDGVVISGGMNGFLSAYDTTGRKLADFVSHAGEVLGIAVDGDRLVSGSSDQTIRVWDLKGIRDIKPVINYEFLEKEKISAEKQTGKTWTIEAVKEFLDKKGKGHLYLKKEKVNPVISLFVANNNEWVAWTDEGYFHASKYGARFVGYHINQGADKEAYFVSLNNLYDVFYRPDIIMAKLKGEDISGLITLTAEQALKNPPPTVKFTSVPSRSDKQKVQVCYEATSNGGGIGEVRVFHNAKLVKSDGYYREVAARPAADKLQLASFNSRAIYANLRSITIKEKNATIITGKTKGERYESCTEIESMPGENEVSIAAFNSSNTVQSVMETATFQSKVAPSLPHLYILAVGIDNYRDSNINLKYAAKDATDFHRTMIAQAGTLYGKDQVHYELLQNNKATRQGIMDKISQMSQVIKAGDGFILFVASHGVLLDNQYYIVTHDYNGMVASGSLISSNEIVEMSKKIRSLSQLYIFDTCHAGGVDNIISGLYDARMSVLAKKMGLHIYASAGSVQQALDGYQGNGLFTHTLLKGLNNEKTVDKNDDKKISVMELGDYSKQKTTDISTELGHAQSPLIINFGRDNPLYELK